MKNLLPILLIISISSNIFAQHLVKKWQTPNNLKTPESVLYHQSSGNIFVSNINGNPNQKDGNGFISILNEKGDILHYNWLENLNAPKGMCIINSTLYVTDIDELVEIDIAKATIIKRHEFKDAKFLNDVAASDKGILYISDSKTGIIHKLENGKLSTWLNNKKLKGANGLLVHKNKLLVGCNYLYSVDLTTKEIEEISTDTGENIDGIVVSRDNLIFFSHWSGKIFKIDYGKKPKKVISTNNTHVQSADIGIIKNKNIILVPTFYDNRVEAYQIKY